MQWFDGVKKTTLPLAHDALRSRSVRCASLSIPLYTEQEGQLQPTVQAGDEVQAGTLLGERGNGKVFSPVNATVKEITLVPHPLGIRAVNAVILETQAGEQTHIGAIDPIADVLKADAETLRDKLDEAGMASFLLDKSLDEILPKPGGDVRIETLVINAADQDLGLVSRLGQAVEQSENLVGAISALAKMTGAKQIFLASPPQSKNAFDRLIKQTEINAMVYEVQPVYPKSADGMILRALQKTGVNPKTTAIVPVAFALSAWNLFEKGEMPHHVFLTVVPKTGERINVKTPIGTPLRDVVDAVGLRIDAFDRVLFGGAMMGFAQFSLDTPVIAGVEGITVIPQSSLDDAVTRPCIGCGKCLDVCPVNLQAQTMGRLAEYGRFSEIEHIEDCLLCGLCAYVCPSIRPMRQWFRLAKNIHNATKETNEA